jgi:putative phosphoribosyl transferase
MIFKDRRVAGLALARIMKESQDWEGSLVLGLPRGGVPVAFEVARVLDLPLDVLIVRKLGVPGHQELAMGAVANGATMVVIESIVKEFAISHELVEEMAKREQPEIERRELLYRAGRPPARIDDRVVILVDDGLATGASMLAAVRAVRPRARQVIVAVPVAAESTCRQLSREVDQVFCFATPRSFIAVGLFYRNFEPTSDEEVRSLLEQARTDGTTQAA